MWDTKITLDDDNGYYYLIQDTYPAECPQGDLDRCYVPKYPWIVRLFSFIFEDNIDFECKAGEFFSPKDEAHFDFSSLSSIKNEIVDKWGIDRVSKYSNENEVLARYWKQFGRCSVFFKGIDSGLKFYQKSLELFDKYNMDTILRQSNITPGKSYTYQEISEAASKGIGGKHVKMTCVSSYGNKPRKQILDNIGFYMDKNFNPTNPTDIESPSDRFFTCDRERVILYQGLMDYVDKERQRIGSIRPIF
ncbi:hypothetical protein KQX54_003588 [Cotesia glomerata]|uniref:Uncharacterized protein n=1 Tax=Cotesia glomerata TaxID=32391 RepID=A0AAV7IJR5_COTGL|nr:hypothetical protein KQX54_003588 [Cotesia glomerata]